MNELIQNFYDKFQVKDLNLYETDYWVWSLRPVQITLGSGILSLKRECRNFSDLKPEEFCDLHNIIRIIETTLKKTFSYNIMNYLMLMMNDPIVHYHVIPRYDSIIEYDGLFYKDKDWPLVPNLTGNEMELRILKQILVSIKSDLVL